MIPEDLLQFNELLRRGAFFEASLAAARLSIPFFNDLIS